MSLSIVLAIGSSSAAFAADVSAPGDSDEVAVPVVVSPVTRPETSTSNASAPGASQIAPQSVALCTFFGRVDYAHISSTSSNLAVQSHGGWENGNCKATLADVTVGVMKKNTIGVFVDVGTLGKKRLKSGEWGSGHWAVAHYDCKSRAKHYFQSWVDVDLVGYSDWINKTFSPPIARDCN